MLKFLSFTDRHFPTHYIFSVLAFLLHLFSTFFYFTFRKSF